MHAWFDESPDRPWATCPLTEAGFVRVSSNRKALGDAVAVSTARSVLSGLRGVGDLPVAGEAREVGIGHRHVVDEEPMVTDAVLLTVARRHGVRLVTFDAGLADLARGDGVELLRA